MQGDYRNDAELYENVEDVPGERAMFIKAAEIITAYATQNRKHPNRGIKILDLCCGTAPILGHLKITDETLFGEITGVDISAQYLDFARGKYYGILAGQAWDPEHGANTEFIESDAVDYTHPEQVDVIIASSAYHHIEDERKPRFLENVREQLKADGIAVVCENLIPDYEDMAQRAIAVTNFYTERIKELARQGITDNRLGLLCRVLQYELDREYEWKHSYRMFKDNLAEAGLEASTEFKVWPIEELFADSLVGDFVFTVNKK